MTTIIFFIFNIINEMIIYFHLRRYFFVFLHTTENDTCFAMILKKTNAILTILSLLLFVPIFANSQETNENTMTKAIQLFDNGNFAEAEPIFKNLLDEKPDDFMVNYFYGASRTENMHFTTADLEALIKANQEVSPIDINYYFGIQYHARSNWERALKFYNKYNSTASLNEEEKQSVLAKIQQCYDKINPYKAYITDENKDEVIPLVAVTATSETVLISDSVIENEIPELTSETVIVSTIPTADETETEVIQDINFQINSDVTYLRLSQFKTEEGKTFYHKGDSTQKQLDLSLLRLEDLRNKYNKAKKSTDKEMIGQDILSIENETYSLKKDALDFLIQAKSTEAAYWENASDEELEAFENEILEILHPAEPVKDTIAELSVDSTVFINPNILLGTNAVAPPVKNASQTDLIYKIQIGAYSKGLPNYIQRLFDKLALIRKIENYTDSNGVVVYTTGNLTNYEDALKMQNQVRREGIEDAYVVPYFKGKRITLKEAKELEEL